MTAMLILNAIGMTLIATAIVSAMAWAIVTSNHVAPRRLWLRRAWARRQLAQRQLPGALRPGRPAGLFD